MSVEKVLENTDLQKKDIHEIILVGGSTRIPKIRQLVKDYFNGKEPIRGINPDEAVAYGAAVQAGVLGCEEDSGETLPLFVTTLTLGIETVGGVMTKLISRHSVLPKTKAQVFSTAADNQNTVTIQVFEGERPMTKNNHLLGKFDLTGIPPAPRGVPQIEVTFEIDVNYTMRVSAEDKGTGNKETIIITNDQNRLSLIEKMVNDAEKFADDDKKVREKLEARNELESYAYSSKNQIGHKEKLGGKLSEDEKETVSKAVEEKDADVDDFKKQKKELEDVVQPIVSKLYQGQGEQGGGQEGGSPPPGEKTPDEEHYKDEL